MINRARLNRIGVIYADIKALMSKSDRAIDLDVVPEDLDGMTADRIAASRPLPPHARRPARS